MWLLLLLFSFCSWPFLLLCCNRQQLHATAEVAVCKHRGQPDCQVRLGSTWAVLFAVCIAAVAQSTSPAGLCAACWCTLCCRSFVGVEPGALQQDATHAHVSLICDRAASLSADAHRHYSYLNACVLCVMSALLQQSSCGQVCRLACQSCYSNRAVHAMA
jgi:hypothetical protein